MAEINTGLGWAAKDTWLVQAADSAIAAITHAAGATNLPVATSLPDLLSVGAFMGSFPGLYYPDRTSYIYAGAGPGDEVVAFWVGGSITFASPTPNCPVYFARRVEPTGTTDLITLQTGSSVTANSLYTTRYPVADTQVTPGPGVFTYSSEIEGCNAITINRVSFTKSNAGYAVACLAKWKTPNGTLITSPILISSKTEYVDMDQPADTSYNLAKLNVLRNGIRYYMSFYDITDGPAITSTLPVFDKTGEEDNPLSLQQVFAYIADLDHAAILELNSPDPYEEEGGASGEEGGDGEDQEDDPVDEETLPAPSVAGHGFCTIYVPSSQELGQMASYLWSGAFDVDQVIKLFSNPMDSILGLSAVPVDLSGTPEQIYLGGVALTNITMPKYTGRTSVKVSFGTATIENRWASYLDYDPYTEFSIYLPFIGIKPLKADDIMGKTISLMYNIDILSGGCVAYIRPVGGSVLYEWSGQCGLQIPVTSRNYDNVFQTAMSVVGAVGAAVVAPASAPVLSGAVASAAVQAAATKPRIERSGTVNGITGFLGQLRPYIIRTIPEAYIPADQNKFIGYPAYINVDLANVRGYNEVDSIHLENVTATGAELDEIESILKGGAIF